MKKIISCLLSLTLITGITLGTYSVTTKSVNCLASTESGGDSADRKPYTGD